MVISELVKKISQMLSVTSESPLLDAKQIVKLVLNIDDVSLVTKAFSPVSQSDEKKALELAKKRINNMPMAYITGLREFMSLNFEVSPGVLIPRPDTECVTEAVIEQIEYGKILDIGTGSGAIAVSLAKYIPEADIFALDVSEYALSVAKKNAENNGADISFIKGDIRDFETDMVFDCIVSNPPYIESDEIEKLMPDVREYEPLSALDGGIDGLDFYRVITKFALQHLRSGGWLFFEMGWKQFDMVSEILDKAGFSEISPIFDLSGIKRGCKALKNF